MSDTSPVRDDDFKQCFIPLPSNRTRAKDPFIPHVIGEADFANGTAYRIVQVKAGGSCKIIDLGTDKYSYAGSIAKAWSSVRYQASITQRTENTTGWRGP